MKTIGENCVDLCSLKGSGLFESKISWPSQVIIKDVIVKFKFSVDLEELILAILQQPFLQFLHIDVSKLLIHFGVVDVDSIKAQIIQHVSVLVEFLLKMDVAFLAFQGFKVDKPRSEKARACSQRLHEFLLQNIAIVVGQQMGAN